VNADIPWPSLPTCSCGAPYRVMLRDRYGAELECTVCHQEHVVWFTANETAALDAYWRAAREGG
jgi:hypothetical protein